MSTPPDGAADIAARRVRALAPPRQERALASRTPSVRDKSF